MVTGTCQDSLLALRQQQAELAQVCVWGGGEGRGVSAHARRLGWGRGTGGCVCWTVVLHVVVVLVVVAARWVYSKHDSLLALRQQQAELAQVRVVASCAQRVQA